MLIGLATTGLIQLTGVMLDGWGVMQLGDDGSMVGVIGPSVGHSNGLYFILSRTRVLKQVVLQRFTQMSVIYINILIEPGALSQGTCPHFSFIADISK